MDNNKVSVELSQSFELFLKNEISNAEAFINKSDDHDEISFLYHFKGGLEKALDGFKKIKENAL